MIRRAVFSGFTTRALAEVIAEVVSRRPDLSGVWHVAAEPINKFDLLSLIKEVYGLRVSVAPRGEKEISPFTSGELMVIEGDHHVATVPVEVSREGKKFTFRFRVSPAAAAASRFDIREQGWTTLHENGVPKSVMTLGGQAFWFWVRDFVDHGPNARATPSE